MNLLKRHRDHGATQDENDDDPLASLQKQRKWDELRDRAHREAAAYYNRYFLELVLRRKPLKPSKDGRHVPMNLEVDQTLIDERRGQPFVSNTIRTSRYTVWDFIPKQLFFQFTRLANFYFLCIGIPQAIPGLSTTGSYTTILPLCFFILLTICKEGYDDFKRHRLDKVENANPTTVLRKHGAEAVIAASPRRWFPPKSTPVDEKVEAVSQDSDQDYGWRQLQWSQVRVGDIVKMQRDERAPADLVFLHATGDEGVAYIDTMDLDGETSLKSKEPLADFKDCADIAGLRACQAEFVVEDPNPNLYQFDGRVTVNGKTVPLTSAEVVYRGSTLRNTASATGIVINTGEECKIRLNANQHPTAKKPALESIANKIVIMLVVYVIILTTGCSRGYRFWSSTVERDSPYLDGQTVPQVDIVVGYAIMFNNNIPLALYITLEIVRIAQMLMLNGDLDMYDEVSDTPAQCNTNTILENLGQVSYIFSDKTGTLTENVMKFRKLSIAGTSWLHTMDMDEEFQPEPATPATPATPDVALRPMPSITLRRPSYLRTETYDTKSIATEYGPRPSQDVELAPLSATQSRVPSRSGRRSSSQWRSTGRPDHIQPELNTTDLLEFIGLRPSSPFARRAKDYILSMALCHTCLPEMKDGQIDYQASSPDELALVRAAQEMGYVVIQRSSQTVTLNIKEASGAIRTEVYQILDVIEFSSKRKRMSIVVRFPDGRVCIICKGADSAILPRLKLANLAKQKATEVRKSADLEREMIRQSEQQEVRNSFGGRPSLNIRRSYVSERQSIGASRSPDPSSRSTRPGFERSKSVGLLRQKFAEDKPRPSLGVRTTSMDVTRVISSASSLSVPADRGDPSKFNFLDDPLINDESVVFSRCFKHLDDFATEGLRTLLFARKFITEGEYVSWRKIYNEATTSLVDRQDMIEAAGEMIEQQFDLVGATAIEDKLQAGVPETIDKLRRANIKIWMLTGDKRETAINIAHSARICQPASDIFILDSTKSALDSQIRDIAEDIKTGCVHSVVVIDGQTLAVVQESPALEALFYALIPTIDSVICCRASPAQKALIVKAIRSREPKSLTLAIGDGANDLAMISASHVGVGISGKEGLQAARVADYAIAQFRFLQRLLLVHGRWNYIRTARFYLATFWKEMFFYLPTAMYQMHNGYSGTSLYESWSLTVFNVLFTSLCVICMGVWEQDLNADTLLAVPELYVYGQRNMELNIPRFLTWMAAAAAEGVLVWLGLWAAYGVYGIPRDDNLFALGDLAFTICVIWINWKLMIIETHHKTGVIFFCFWLTIAGWFAWNGFLTGSYAQQPSPYAVRHGFSDTFGLDPVWWLTIIIEIAALVTLEMTYKAFKHRLMVAGLWSWTPWKRPSDPDDSAEDWHLETWQELEKDPVIQERIAEILRKEKEGLTGEEETTADDELKEMDMGRVV